MKKVSFTNEIHTLHKNRKNLGKNSFMENKEKKIEEKKFKGK